MLVLSDSFVEAITTSCMVVIAAISLGKMALFPGSSMPARLASFVALVAIALGIMNLFTSFDPASMKGKRVVVTGASMGIGEQMAYELGKMKARVVLVARSKDKLERISRKSLQLGAQEAYYISADLSSKNESDMKYVIDQSVKLLGGGMDMLILNHLSPGDVLVHSGWPERFRAEGLPWLVDQFYLNVFNYFTLSNYALPYLEAKAGGRLVVVSSTTGIIGVSKTVGYSAQKHALHGYYNALRSNLRQQNRYNVSISIAVLGAIATETFQEHAGQNVKISAEPADDCARSIIAAGAIGERTLYYPYRLLRPASILYTLFPDLLEMIQRSIMTE